MVMCVKSSADILYSFTTSSLFIDDTNQILGKVATDSTYRDNLQTSFSVLSEWINYDFVLKNPSIDYSIYENKATEFNLLDIPDDPSEIELKLNPFFDPIENQKIILEIYNKLKQVFSILELLLSVELFFFAYIITLFSQQFGGNRDLPVLSH